MPLLMRYALHVCALQRQGGVGGTDYGVERADLED